MNLNQFECNLVPGADLCWIDRAGTVRKHHIDYIKDGYAVQETGPSDQRGLVRLTDLEPLVLMQGLSKWPQMIVSGQSVSQDQVKNILLRTDPFLTDAYEHAGGNCHEFNQNYRVRAGLTRLQREKSQLREDGSSYSYISVDYRAQKCLHCELGVLPLEYAVNDWASSSFIGGPHGWCSPDGTISFRDNIGKCPSLARVITEWRAIAQAFPYLDVHVTIMHDSAGSNDNSPLVNIRVINGAARFAPPDLSVHASDGVTPCDYTFDWIANSRHELGLPAEWYDEFAAIVAAAVDQQLALQNQAS